MQNYFCFGYNEIHASNASDDTYRNEIFRVTREFLNTAISILARIFLTPAWLHEDKSDKINIAIH
jgi:hypothetical protein